MQSGLPLLLPRTEIIKGNSHHELEVKATSAYQTVYSDVTACLLDFRKVLVELLSDSLKRFGVRLVSSEFATPFTAYLVKGHRSICQRNSTESGGGSASS